MRKKATGQDEMEYTYHAGIYLSKQSALHLKKVLARIGINEHAFIQHPHLTIYYAKTDLPFQHSFDRSCELQISAEFLRFMVMAPGGENARETITPRFHKVGLRIQRQADAIPSIYQLRQEMIDLESELLQVHQPSTMRRSAFGAPNFQPHVTILNPNNGIQDQLKPYGDALRESLGALHFDRYCLRKNAIQGLGV
jgi:2'-5' RNA ligase